MAKRTWIIALSGCLCTASSLYAQPTPEKLPPGQSAQTEAEKAQAAEVARKARVDREAATAREEEALSRPASWSSVSIAELEKSVGGRTMIEVKVQNATPDEVATVLSAQSGLDIFTQSGNWGSSKLSFDISKRPFWEALRAMSIAQAASQNRGRTNSNGSNRGRSIFSDLNSSRGPLFSTSGPSLTPSLALSPVVLVRPSAYEIEATERMAASAPPEQRKNWLRQVRTPQEKPASPRSAGARWQLNQSSPSTGGGLAQGRSFSSWPCLFVVDYLARQQDNYLSPDVSEAPAATTEEAGPELTASPQVLVAPAASGAVESKDEWQQSVALQMRAYVDPRVRQYRNVRLIVDEARDEAGNDLRRPDFTKPRRIRLDQRPDLDLPIALQLPRERGDKNTKLHLRGALLFWVPARISTTEFALGADGTAMRQAILWGQAADLKVKLSQGPDKSWFLSSDVALKGERGQFDFRREMGTALNDDDSYRAGLVLPGGVRVQSTDGTEWKLRPFSEEQKLTLNVGENMISRKTDFIGAFRRGRSASGSFEGNTSGSGGSFGSSGSVPFELPYNAVSMQRAVGPVAVGPDGYAYSENVTWQLEPSAAGGARGTAEAPPAITKIFFDTPQEWREVRIPFEFHDLPLPPQ